MARVTIAYAAGKSGGHILPCLTLFNQERERIGDLHGLFFTTNAPLDSVVLPDSTPDLFICRLPLHTAVRNPLRLAFIGIGLFRSFLASFWYLLKYRPVLIVTTGGLTAVPVCLMGWLLRIPIDLYELNAEVGKATRFLSPCATRVLICFAEAQRSFRSQACIVTPYPLRFALASKLDPTHARLKLALSPEIPTITILGGSQGSVQLNTLVKLAFSHYAKPVQIIHQTGSNDTFNWQAWYLERNILAVVFAYNDNLSDAIIAADVVICRAGAGTLFECMAYNKKMIVIPLEGVADDHQVANAYACQRTYQDTVTLRQQRLDYHPSLLITTIDMFLYPPHALAPSHKYTHTIS